jgi:Tfp pilus assembly PilM family ATPase
LADYLRKELGVTVELVRPLAAVKTVKGTVQVDLNNPDFAVSTGLALRGLEGER